MNQQNYRPTPQPRRRSNCSSYLGILVLVGIGAAYFGYGWWQDRLFNQTYDKAVAAYESGNCVEAKQHFDEVAAHANFFKSGIDVQNMTTRGGSACGNFNTGVEFETQSDFQTALSYYHFAIAGHPESLPQPVNDQIVQRVNGIFTSNSAETLAGSLFCYDVVRTPTTFTTFNTGSGAPTVEPALMTRLNEISLIPEPEKNLPLLTYECARYALNANEFEQASTLYTRFIENYPDHELAVDAEAGLAEAIVQVANSSNAPEISRPEGQAVGGTVASVSIQNSSPERMRLTFVGPEIQVYQLEACTNCITYTGTGPAACPEEGPQGYYELPPGTYQVVVESIGEYVTPYRGTWELESGFDYPQCFYIVESF